MFSSVVASGHNACTPNTINEIPESVNESGMSEGDHEDNAVCEEPMSQETTTTSEIRRKRNKRKN
ncbi:hypothetical protein KSP40_PGU018486 [Platanthera guangdongensis]|uniref:Uncharacterized protein n=1 Tax=Platanthera guangdongensis TaxID=2320717 RepID=A0ABR2MLW5_9ASPA